VVVLQLRPTLQKVGYEALSIWFVSLTRTRDVFSCFAAARHACFFLSVSSIPSGTCRCVKYRTESREYDDEG